MANTYHQIYLQLVFSVKNRESLIKEINRDQVEKYMCEIVSKRRCRPLAIYCNPDHTHLLLDLQPVVCISDLVRDIKTGTTKFIKNELNNKNYFEWQEGYAVFSYSVSQVEAVVKYILNQEKHHLRRNFREEYLTMLKNAQIDYDERYLFDFID